VLHYSLHEQVSVDHQAQCLRFTAAVMETEGMRTQLTALAKQLNTVVNIIAPHSNGSTATTRTIEERRAFFDKVCYSLQSFIK
jgi:hypothetical protein